MSGATNTPVYALSAKKKFGGLGDNGPITWLAVAPDQRTQRSWFHVDYPGVDIVQYIYMSLFKICRRWL